MVRVRGAAGIRGWGPGMLLNTPRCTERPPRCRIMGPKEDMQMTTGYMTRRSMLLIIREQMILTSHPLQRPLSQNPETRGWGGVGPSLPAVGMRTVWRCLRAQMRAAVWSRNPTRPEIRVLRPYCPPRVRHSIVHSS